MEQILEKVGPAFPRLAVLNGKNCSQIIDCGFPKLNLSCLFAFVQKPFKLKGV